MENSKPSVFWWILGAKRSLWPTPMFLQTNSPKNMNPPNGGAYSKPIMRRLCRGGDEQIDVKIQFTGVVDGSVSPRVAQYGVSPYLVPNLPWDMVLGHPWGYEHCVSHFARFNCLYSHHPVHPRFWIEDFREAPRTGKPFLVKPIHGKVSRQSVWGITVPIVGAVTPMHPAPAIVVTPAGGEPPNRVEAEKHISYALTASSVAPVQDRACALGALSHSARTARAQRAHSARTAPIITVIIRVTAPKTTHLRNHAQPIQISKIQTSDACHGSQGPKFCPLSPRPLQQPFNDVLSIF